MNRLGPILPALLALVIATGALVLVLRTADIVDATMHQIEEGKANG